MKLTPRYVDDGRPDWDDEDGGVCLTRTKTRRVAPPSVDAVDPSIITRRKKRASKRAPTACP